MGSFIEVGNAPRDRLRTCHAAGMGAYVEETRGGPGPVAGVPTGTLGMAGITAYGPVPHPSNDGQGGGGPVLVTSVTEYQRTYGGLTIDGTACRLALAAQAFFANGGQRLYVQRVFVPTPDGVGTGPDGDVAAAELPAGSRRPTLRWVARWPGTAGSRIRVVTRLSGGEHHRGTRLRGGNAASHRTLDVEVQLGDRRVVFPGLGLDPGHPNHVATVLSRARPADEGSLVWLDLGPAAEEHAHGGLTPGQLLSALLSPGEQGVQLSGGSDGGELRPSALTGTAGDPDTSSPATGLAALAEVDDVAIVAVPDSTSFPDVDSVAEVVDALIAHCERDRYRFAVIDPPQTSDIAEVRAFRSRFDTSFAAMYHPWLQVADPTESTDPSAPGQPPATLAVPPSGAVAGILARSDRERGVHVAPANQEVRDIVGLATTLTAAEQGALGPEGVNVLRTVQGRGHLVWGARTMSSDPDWRYVSVRRLLIFLERSIDSATGWAVFEPNDEQLWHEVRRTVEDFLTSAWRTGALLGSTPEEAFFVRCDRTTMTQNDLDNGRLVCLVGVAPTRPAEFLVFRIGQWTADRTVPTP